MYPGIVLMLGVTCGVALVVGTLVYQVVQQRQQQQYRAYKREFYMDENKIKISNNSQNGSPSSSRKCRKRLGSQNPAASESVEVRLECSICVEDVMESQPNTVTLICTHVFHVSCIRQWLDKCVTKSCPNCRIPIVDIL